MHLGQGGLDKPSVKRRSQEEAGGNEDGGADERGEEGPMPWCLKKNSNKYFL